MNTEAFTTSKQRDLEMEGSIHLFVDIVHCDTLERLKYPPKVRDREETEILSAWIIFKFPSTPDTSKSQSTPIDLPLLLSCMKQAIGRAFDKKGKMVEKTPLHCALGSWKLYSN